MTQSPSRLDQLEKMLKQDPHDAFIQYAVAMEYARLGQSTQAVERFKLLIHEHPDYAAAYFMCGRTLEQMDQRAGAGEMYRSGIASARRVGDDHAAGEMLAALEAIT